MDASSNEDRAFAASPSSPSVSPVPASIPCAVLFLDIDGVVLDGPNLWRHGNRYLPPEKVALVREVCDRAGALVVVSSTWRYSDETADMLRFVGIPLHRDWRTPRARQEGNLLIALCRGSEIQRWLDRNPEITSYAIVDDDSDMLPGQMERFVQTSFDVGIERDHVERLVSVLAIAMEAAKPLRP